MRKLIIISLLLLFPVHLLANNTGLEMFMGLQAKIIEVSNEIKPVVVHIEAVQKKGGAKRRVLGSGVLLDREGYIVTTEHLISEADEARVTMLNDVTKYRAKIIGIDKLTDLALLKIEHQQELKYPVLGDSDTTCVGEWVIAIGNPYGLDGTVYLGIISAKGRDIESEGEIINEFLQTDTSIDPGSSGGPLVNLKGEVIGINSGGAGRGISFTIPITVVKKVINKLKTQGEIERGWIGVSIQEFNRDIAQQFGLPEVTGVIINGVFENSPAAESGLKPLDIITEFDGKKVKAEKPEAVNELIRIVGDSKIGQEVQMKIIRDKQPLSLTLKIAKQPKIKADELETDFGFAVKEITDYIYRNYKLDSKDGVFVSEVKWDTCASDAQLYEKDIIIKINDMEIKDIKDFKKTIETVKDNNRILLQVKRQKDLILILLKTGEFKKKW
ncbi:MAG: trypsin-like peptidase domain-containing protein [bacterium]